VSASTEKSIFLLGFSHGAPFVLVILPFGLLFGVVATEAGLNVAEVMGMSVVVLAGAAQFTAISLMQENAPTVIVILTSLAVNLRMAMYSAGLAPHLGAVPFWKRAVAAYVIADQNYAICNLTFDKVSWRPDQKFVYFIGTMTPIVPTWIISSFIGAYIGETIPPWMALDFALPITFLALIAPALRTLAHVAAAVTSVVMAIGLAWMPFSTGLLVAAALAMAVGAEVERRTQ